MQIKLWCFGKIRRIKTQTKENQKMKHILLSVCLMLAALSVNAGENPHSVAVKGSLDFKIHLLQSDLDSVKEAAEIMDAMGSKGSRQREIRLWNIYTDHREKLLAALGDANIDLGESSTVVQRAALSKVIQSDKAVFDHLSSRSMPFAISAIEIPVSIDRE